MRFALEEAKIEPATERYSNSVDQKVIRARSDKDLHELRDELDMFFITMSKFDEAESAEIFQNLAAFTARASYLRSQIMRIPENRMMTAFRTKELDPFIEECDRQFKIWSRAFSVQSQEWEMTRGI